jgi:hypothetical protein
MVYSYVDGILHQSHRGSFGKMQHGIDVQPDFLAAQSD